MSFLNKIFKDPSQKALDRYLARVSSINVLEQKMLDLKDAEFATYTSKLKERISLGENIDSILPEAFALVREAARRTLGERHYDVQLIGGMIINDGNIAEMRTGEGKTLVATLPVYLNALRGQGVHIVTVNDYLARRDAVWMGQIYSILGMSVSVINQQSSYIYDSSHTELDKERDVVGSFKVVYDFLRPIGRKEAYQADITYGTNSEFGFDFLRDNIEYDLNNIRQRGHHFAIVDEIDSILIDEARTPLIISAPSSDAENLYSVFAHIASDLKEGEDYTLDEKDRAISLTDVGITKAEKKLGIENIYTEKGIKYVHHLETSVRAKALFLKDREYVVRDDQVVIVDPFTGRMQPSRRWSEGIHQAVEAKEGLPIQQESRTYASVSYQNYFKLYEKLSGMTGTAKTSSEEFYKVYGLDVIEVPTHRPIARIDKTDVIFKNEHGKFTAIAEKAKELHKKGQPVLIGTVSIEKNEQLSAYLHRFGVPHNVLNAKNHDREAEIIAQAGKKSAVTIATNMAGRGVDIKLGGLPFNKEKWEDVRNLGGLYVIGTERHEARRIDNQLRGRSGRQGDPGETQFYVSLEDPLMRVFASEMVKGIMGKLGLPENVPIESKMVSRSIETAQTRIEGFHFDSRKHLLEFDSVLNTQRQSIYERRRKVLTGDHDFLLSEYERLLQLATPGTREIIQEKRNKIGDSEFYNVFRRALLQSTDMYWIDHLEIMDHMRSSVSLRAYGQRDPLVEYKKEGLKLFKSMLESVDMQVVNILPQITMNALQAEEQKMKEVIKNATLITDSENTEESNIILKDKRGRNDKVIVSKGKEIKEIKMKKLEEYLKDGWVEKK
jgi:preprotein translocase subunit SecA